MKVLKGISLFLLYPLLLLALGFFAGVKSMHFFYPAAEAERPAEQREIVTGENLRENNASAVPLQKGPDSADKKTDNVMQGFLDVSTKKDTLGTETEYILEENDILKHSVVETKWRLPAKYVGMNREQFLQAMERYAASPPLAELERGFVGLEVMQFSRERVVVQMNYRYIQPSASFYLAVSNNEVVVLLEDQKTVYINTGIQLEELPEEIQKEIINMLFVENEVKLYDILETYSS